LDGLTSLSLESAQILSDSIGIVGPEKIFKLLTINDLQLQKSFPLSQVNRLPPQLSGKT
jgi:hypothetical protein